MPAHKKFEPKDRAEHFSKRRQPSTTVQSAPTPVEPEDAYLTGASRSLQRRLSGLNIESGRAQRHPEMPAGWHSTGSFTRESKKK